jgi:hypothetical protein
MIDIEHIQKLYTLFNHNQQRAVIKSEKYDVVLEKLEFADNTGNNNNVILSLYSNKPLDLNYTLQKICEYKYSKFQVGIDKNIIQISYNIDIKYLTINLIFDNIYLMEQLV